MVYIVMCALAAFHKHHPVNLILLGMFTLTIAFTMGLSCAFVKGKKEQNYNIILFIWSALCYGNFICFFTCWNGFLG